MTSTAWAGVVEALHEFDFPATKQQIVAYAEQYGADAQALRLLRGLPVATYRNMTEIRRSVPLEPTADDDVDSAARVARIRSPHSHRIAEHLRDT
jgi:hypothetical protein